MAECKACGNKPKKSRVFPSAVVEINNPEQLVLLRKVVMPSTLLEADNPPVIGKYRNVILQYEDTGNVYLYSSDGIPTRIDATVPQEVLDRITELEGETADLQDQIDDLKNSPDVVDVVATYAELQAYDTSKLGDNDVIRVLADETRNGDSTYYRWDKQNETWTYIGSIHIDERAFKPFPSSVNTTGTTQQFLNSVLALQAETGMAYLGTVSLSDMPAGLIQEEVEVYVYSDYVVYAIMRSTDVAPYAWWCASYNYGGWRPIGDGAEAFTNNEWNTMWA